MRRAEDPFPKAIALPLVPDRSERGDAAANRIRILAAARELLATRGPDSVSMEAVAAAAGVGKGTVFRRFGDRAGLMGELINEYMRDFQDAFLSGPPPLGPGAPPARRLVAFTDGLIALQLDHLPVALAGEHRLPGGPRGVAGSLRIHLSALIEEIDPRLDAEVLAAMLLAAMSAQVLQRLEADGDRVRASVAVLLGGILDS